MLDLGARPTLVLGTGERERGVVGGVEQIEVGEVLGQVHDDLPGRAGDPPRHAEQDPPERLGVASQRRVLVGRLPGGGRRRADVADEGG